MNRPVRYLWLLRHAKAAPNSPRGGGDRDRPLTPRGRRDAAALGRRLAAEPIDLRLEVGGDLPPPDGGPGTFVVPRPEIALCSAAERTQQTTALIVEALGGEMPVSAYRSLYAAEPDAMLQYVREIDEGVASALLVGHNPTVFEVAWQLLADPVGPVEPTRWGDAPTRSDRDVLEAHGFPTCALAVLALEVTAWEDAAHGCGRLLGVFRPPY